MKKIAAFFRREFKKKRFLIPLAAITLICCLTAISGLNKPHLNPFVSKLRTKYPSGAAYSDCGSELIDNDKQRLLILDENDRLSAVVDASKSGSPIDQFNAVTMYADRIFVIGTESFNRGSYYSSEKIVEYSLSGEYVGTVYTESYTEDEKISCRRFADISACGDSLYLTKILNKEVTVLRFSGESGTETLGTWTIPETAYTAGYAYDGNYCLAVGLSKNCYVVDCDTGEIIFLTFEEYLAALFEMYNISPDEIDANIFDDAYCFPAVVLNEDGVARYYCIVDANGELRLTLSNDTGVQSDISSVSYSPGLRLRTLGYWAAVGFLALEVMALLGSMLATKKFPGAGKLLLLIGITVLISGFYTNQIRQSAEESYIKSLKTQALQISYVLSEGCGDIFQSIREEGIYAFCSDLTNQPDMDELRLILKNLCDKNDSTQFCYAGCYLYDLDGVLYTFADSINAEPAGQPVYMNETQHAIMEQGHTGSLTADTFSESLIYDYEDIYADDGTLVGYLFLCGTRANLLYVQKQNFINMTVSLLALLIGLYMVITLYNRFSADLKRRMARDPADKEAKSLDMAGILSFMQGIIYSLDAVILVYVAKSLCVGLPDTEVAFLVSLPITAGSLGNMAGMSLLNPLRKRLGDRALAIVSAGATLGGMLLLAFSVQTNSIYLFSAGCFVKSLFLSGIFHGIVQTIPYRVALPEERTAILVSVSEGNIAASIISALIGGYVSQYLSYTAIYLLAAVLCGLLIFLCTLGFVKKGDPAGGTEPKAESTAGGLKCWAFFLRGPGLVYIIFYVFPLVITGGYKSYLFPLYSADTGFSALLLSNLSVFVTTFSFITGPALRELGKKLERTVALAAPQLIVSVCLICFILSPNIYWAIAMLFIYQAMQSIASNAGFAHLNELAENSNLDAKQVFGINLRIRNFYSTVRSPILSAAVMLGMNYACTVVGVICGAMYSVFLFFENKRKKHKPAVPLKE